MLFACNCHFYHNHQIIIIYCNVNNILLLLFSFSSSSYSRCHHYHHPIICRYNYAFHYIWSWTLLVVIIIFIIVVIFCLVVTINIINITTITDIRLDISQAKLTTEKGFLSPWWGWNPKPFDDRWAALNIELPRLRWWAKVGVRHVCSLCGGYDMFIILLSTTDIWNVRACRYYTFVRLKLTTKKLFPSSKRGPNVQPFNDLWNALTIELPRFRWRAKVRVWYSTTLRCLMS